MSYENLEVRPTWNMDPGNIPIVLCPQPNGPTISLIFKSSWGSSQVEIQSVKIQDQNGKIVDVVIPNKWYLNADLFPESINFPLSIPTRPAFIIIQNGISSKGVKEVEVRYSEKTIWNGEVPMGTQENCSFPIAVPIEAKEFKKPTITAFRNVSFPMSQPK